MFILKKPEMRFKVSGGDHPTTYIALCTVDGKEHQAAQGRRSEVFRVVQWKTPELVGKKVFVRLSDHHRGGWGHIVMDSFTAVGEIDPTATEAYLKTRKPMPKAGGKAPAKPGSEKSLRVGRQAG